ncbi:MAG: DUF1080 domain-containing protein [Planctomycetaceae bacterium]|jgi:hypothetical protein|nr:DUF1080 domain-containing protein [Planctomycetaceae bacterium]
MMKHAAVKNAAVKFAAVLCFALIAGFGVGAYAAVPEYTSVGEIAKDENLYRDFQVQGEYEVTGTQVPVGCNIIAEGSGKFRTAAFKKGLPPASQRGDEKQTGTGEINAQGYFVSSTKDSDVQIEFKIAPGTLTAAVKGDSQPVLRKVERKSPTLGLKAPEGAVVLFADGKASDLFTKANVNETDKTLWAEAETKPFEKRPYTLHVEFMTSYMPTARGQGRSNSGVYIDERYECQILDSFGLDGKNNECGGFYQQAEPKVNMCYPPLQWQTYDIDFAPAKYDADGKKTANAVISVKHNGVVIHDKFEPKHETPGRKKEGAEPLGLYLQGHGNKAQYRNIWLKYN